MAYDQKLITELEAKAKNTNEDTDSVEGANVKSPKVTVAQVRNILDENIKVYPGHGSSTTIKHEKENNPFFGVKSNCSF